MKKIVLISVLAVLLGISGCGVSDVTDQVANISQATDEHVLMVKKGHPNSYPDITFEQAFESFFGNPTWKYFVGTKEGSDDDDDGEPDYEVDNVDVVEFTGYCTYSGVEVKALIQFTLNDDDTFDASYLSLNEVPQNMLMLGSLIGKAFDEYQASHGNNNSESISKEEDKDVDHSSYEIPEKEPIEEKSSEISSIDYDDLMDTIMTYYAMNYGTNSIAAEVDYEDKDTVVIWLYDPNATTTSSNLGYYEYNKNTGIWSDSVTGELVDFESAADTYNQMLDARSTYPDQDYILPYSSEKALTESDLSQLSAKELTYARNEIYARHGYVFKASELNDYFNSTSWYAPNRSFDGTLSGVEQDNVTFIKSYQEKYNLQYSPK